MNSLPHTAPVQARHRQRGVALVIALILLVVTTVIALSSVRFTALDLRIALNEELRMEAVQTSQSMVEAVIANRANLVVFGTEGYTVCTRNLTDCNKNDLRVPESMFGELLANNQAWARVKLLNDAGTPPRLSEQRAVSIRNLSAASFEVESSYDRSAEGLARANIAEGLILFYGKND
jgi:Tfp pilus assembly protein PilX